MEKLLNDLKKRFYQIEVLTHFGGNSDADEGYDIVFDWVSENFPELNISNEVYHGISKLVLDLFPREDFVIKIPFNGLYEGKWNRELEEYDPYHQWRDFKYASTPETQMDYNWDYCNTEVEKFLEIKEKGLACFFAETKVFCSSKNFHPIYIQERVLPINECYSETSSRRKTPSRKSKEKAIEIKNEQRCYVSDVEWIATALEYYGEELTRKLMDYVYEDDIVGQDLHSGNYGYRTSDGSPCILDYSSWNY